MSRAFSDLTEFRRNQERSTTCANRDVYCGSWLCENAAGRVQADWNGQFYPGSAEESRILGLERPNVITGSLWAPWALSEPGAAQPMHLTPGSRPRAV
jgi:hypothetical protein